MNRKIGLQQLKAWEELLVFFSKTWSNIEAQVDGDGFNLPLHWYDVLLVLSRSPDRRRRLSEIADRIVTSRAALSRSLDKLEKAGFIKRQRCPDDGRGQYAVLTDKGLQRMKDTWPAYRAAIEEHFGSKLTNGDARQLVDIISRMKENSAN